MFKECVYCRLRKDVVGLGERMSCKEHPSVVTVKVIDSWPGGRTCPRE